MVWAASTDDASGTAIKALNSAAGRTLGLAERSSLFSYPKEPTGQCVWGECDAGCPSGYQPAVGSGGKVSGYAGIFNGCAKGKSRYYCCPSGSKAPKCTWKGSPKFCGMLSKNRCQSNEVEVTTTTTNPADGTSCWTGHMSLCCEQTSSDSDVGQCSEYYPWHSLEETGSDGIQHGRAPRPSAQQQEYCSVRPSSLRRMDVQMTRLSRLRVSMALVVSNHASTMEDSNLTAAKSQVIRASFVLVRLFLLTTTQIHGRIVTVHGTKAQHILGLAGHNPGSPEVCYTASRHLC
jgi:hypothetical protein